MRRVARVLAGTLHGGPSVAGCGDSSTAPPPREEAAAETIPRRSSIAAHAAGQPANRYRRAAGEPLRRLADRRSKAASEWRGRAARLRSCPVGLSPAAPSPVVL